MTDIEKIKFGMYGEVLNLLGKNIDVTLSIKPVSVLMTKLGRIVDEIERIDKVQPRELIGKTAEVSFRREHLLNDLINVSSALFNYARQTGSIELRDGSRVNPAGLLHLKDEEILLKAEALRMLALKYVPELRRMGITPNALHNMGLKIEYFRRSLESRDFYSGEVCAGKGLSELFSDADQVLENADYLIEPLSDEFEEFYDEYIAVRDLEGRGERKALLDLKEDEDANN